MESWRRELYHHGIKGQKWGVRNGPPYPVKGGRERYGNLSGSAAPGVQNREYVRAQRKYGNIGDSGTARSYISSDAQKLSERFGWPLKQPPDTTISDDAKKTNPGWWDKQESDPRWANNCTHDVIAFSARRKGLDVIATPMSEEEGEKGGAVMLDLLGQCYDYKFDDNENLRANRDFHRVQFSRNYGRNQMMLYATQASEQIGKRYKDAPDGAHGYVDMRTRFGGHVFNWYKEDGSIKFADAQTGLDGASNFETFARVKGGQLIYARLDDKKFKLAVKEAVASAGSSEKELYHHGIKGQKWGVRNGPPYPLNSRTRSASENRARRSGLDNVSGKAYSTHRGLTDRQRRMIATGVWVGLAAVSAYGLYKSGAFGEFQNVGRQAVGNAMGVIGKNPVNSVQNAIPVNAVPITRPSMPVNSTPISNPAMSINSTPITKFTMPKATSPAKLDAVGNKLKVGAEAAQLTHGSGDVKGFGSRGIQELYDDVGAINPSGNLTNCVACVATYDLRARGYDVSANFRSKGDIFRRGELDLLYDDIKWKNITDAKDTRDAFDKVENELLKYGNGARGVFTGKFTEEWIQKAKRIMGPNLKFDGHALSWEINNDRVVFSDGQSENVYVDVFSQMINRFDKDGLSFARLDNQEIDPEFIKVFANNR